MFSKFRYKRLRKLTFTAALIVTLWCAYISLIPVLPVSYWDEFLWTGHTYFFDFYRRADFQNPVWYSPESYDQPKLAEYAFGAWLYPVYLQQRQLNGPEFDYPRFLIAHQLYFINDNYLATYGDDAAKANLIWFNESAKGLPAQYVSQYGEKSLLPLALIYRVRILSALFLAIAVIEFYLVARSLFGVIPAIGGTIIYSLNSYLIDIGVKAQSEALFLALFTGALWCLLRYNIGSRKLHWLILFIFLTGLCLSTKLSGMVLLLFFLSHEASRFIAERKHMFRRMTGVLAAWVGSFLIFIALNPGTYNNPLVKIRYMYEYRQSVALGQTQKFRQNYLPDNLTRLTRLGENFLTGEKRVYFNGLFPLNGTRWTEYAFLIQLALFCTGILWIGKLTITGSTAAGLLLTWFIVGVIFLTEYLLLDWERYYIYLPLLVILFESAGFSLWIRKAQYLLHRSKDREHTMC